LAEQISNPPVDEGRHLNHSDISYVRGILRRRWIGALLSADSTEVTNLLKFYRSRGYSRKQVVEAAKQSHNWSSLRDEMSIVGKPAYDLGELMED